MYRNPFQELKTLVLNIDSKSNIYESSHKFTHWGKSYIPHITVPKVCIKVIYYILRYQRFVLKKRNSILTKVTRLTTGHWKYVVDMVTVLDQDEVVQFINFCLYRFLIIFMKFYVC